VNEERNTRAWWLPSIRRPWHAVEAEAVAALISHARRRTSVSRGSHLQR